MTDLTLDDSVMRDVLSTARVIAVVGHSDNPARPSYSIARYLRLVGYKVYPVNPSVQQIDGERSYASLADVPEPIDIVDVFRRSEYLLGVVEEAVAVGAKTVWAQLGIHNDAAKQRALDAGLNVVTNHCIKVEHSRLAIPQR
jgi:hypothetical protein